MKKTGEKIENIDQTKLDCINYDRNRFSTKFCIRNDIWDFIKKNFNFHAIWP